MIWILLLFLFPIPMEEHTEMSNIKCNSYTIQSDQINDYSLIALTVNPAPFLNDDLNPLFFSGYWKGLSNTVFPSVGERTLFIEDDTDANIIYGIFQGFAGLIYSEDKGYTWSSAPTLKTFSNMICSGGVCYLIDTDGNLYAYEYGDTPFPDAVQVGITHGNKIDNGFVQGGLWYYVASDYSVRSIELGDDYTLATVYDADEFLRIVRVADAVWYAWRVIAVDGNYEIYKSTDQGANWAVITNSTNKHLLGTDGTYIYALDSYTEPATTTSPINTPAIVRTNDDGTTWDVIYRSAELDQIIFYLSLQFHYRDGEWIFSFSKINPASGTPPVACFTYLLRYTAIDDYIRSAVEHKYINCTQPTTLDVMAHQSIINGFSKDIQYTFTDADDNTRFVGYFKGLKNETTATFESIDGELFTTPADINASAKSCNEIMDLLIAKFVDCSSGTIADPDAGTTYEQVYPATVKLNQGLLTYAMAGGGFIRTQADGTFDFITTPSDSTVDWVFGTTIMDVPVPQPSNRGQEFDKLILQGGYDDGGQLQDTLGTGDYPITITRLDIQCQNLVESLAAQLWADMNVDADFAQRITVNIGKNADWVMVGDYVDFDFAPRGIAQGDYIILERHYDIATTRATYVISRTIGLFPYMEQNSLYFPQSDQNVSDSAGGSAVTQHSLAELLAKDYESDAVAAVEACHNIIPSDDATYDIGSSTKRFKRIWLYGDGSSVSLSLLAGTAMRNTDGTGRIYMDSQQWRFRDPDDSYSTILDLDESAITSARKLLPSSDSTLDLGDATHRWNELFIDTITEHCEVVSDLDISNIKFDGDGWRESFPDEIKRISNVKIGKWFDDNEWEVLPDSYNGLVPDKEIIQIEKRVGLNVGKIARLSLLKNQKLEKEVARLTAENERLKNKINEIIEKWPLKLTKL